MAMLVKKENKHLDAIRLLAWVCFWDLTGCSNQFNYNTFFQFTFESLFPYERKRLWIAPGVIRELTACQRKLGITDEQLREHIITDLDKITAPVQFFTYTEVADIIFWERDGEADKLATVYDVAKARFNPAQPNILGQQYG